MMGVTQPPPRYGRIWHRAAWATAGIAGAFCLAMTVLLAVGALRPVTPLDAPHFEKLRSALHADPSNEQIKDQMRRLDAEIRADDLRWRRRQQWGAYLLAGGTAVLLVALRLAAACQPVSPDPPAAGALAAAQQPDARLGRWVLAAVGLAALAGGGAAALRTGEPAWLHADDPAAAVGGRAAPALPGDEQVARQWSRFRGPGGAGIWPHADAPRQWDGPSGLNIAWSLPIPLPGHNSPVVWDNRVFLTGATSARREVYAIDADTGRLAWSRSVDVPRTPGAARIDVYEDTGYAAPSVATDGVHVAALFTTGELACFDVAGNLLWSRRLDVSDNPYGHAASPVLHHGRLILQIDRGSVRDHKSSLLALDASTGRTLWQTPRPVAASWATPIVATIGGRDQLLTIGEPLVVAYDPDTGREIWRADCLGGEIAPSPVLAGDVLIASHPWTELVAVRVDGSGDVSESHVLWKGGDNAPDITTPLAHDGLVYTLSSTGTLTCADADDGRTLWSQELDLDCHASPTLAGGVLHILTDDGTMVLVGTGREFEEIARNPLGQPCAATPAFAPGRIFIRSHTHLFCIAAPPADEPPMHTGEHGQGQSDGRPNPSAASSRVHPGLNVSDRVHPRSSAATTFLRQAPAEGVAP